jgi:hypothetical protein
MMDETANKVGGWKKRPVMKTLIFAGDVFKMSICKTVAARV